MCGAVLSAFSEKAQVYAAKMLEERGVKIHLHMAVKEVGCRSRGALRRPAYPDPHGGLGRRPARLGAVGQMSASSRTWRTSRRPAGSHRAGFPNVYAIGDFANITERGRKVLPQLASVAEQAGKWCAKNIAADIEGKERKPFDYFDKGIMAMIGRSAAVAEIGPKRHELEGPIAFTAWLGVHAALLSTTRARIEAFVEWAWDYFSDVKGDQVLDRFSEESI